MSESARAATGADVARLAELCRQGRDELSGQRGGPVWAAREARPEPVEATLAVAVDDAAQAVVAGCYAGAVVGYAAAHVEDVRDGTALGVLTELYVEPEARGVGVGEAMMDLVLTWCTQHGCAGIDSVVLPGTRDAKNFFERYGLTARAIVVHRRLDAHG